MDLVNRFLKADIIDREGNYACETEEGIPRGSPVSPVLVNACLHLFDVAFSSLWFVLKKRFHHEDKTQIHYLRYADDILFGIPRVKEKSELVQLKDKLRTHKGVCFGVLMGGVSSP